MNGNNRRFTVLLLCSAILLAVFFTATADSREYSGIYSNTLRFHVLANSDTEEDQKLKLAVKDAVILRIFPSSASATTLYHRTGIINGKAR